MCAQGGREEDKSSLMTKASVIVGGLLMPVVMDNGYPLSHTHVLVLPQARAWSSEGEGESAQQHSRRGDGPSHHLTGTPSSVSWKE